MKRAALFLAFLFLPAAACAAAPEPGQDLFSQANAAYESGDFSKAVELYEKSADTSPSSTVYYNLGNAHFKKGERGRALLNYRRASRFSPRDKDVLWNISVVK